MHIAQAKQSRLLSNQVPASCVYLACLYSRYSHAIYLEYKLFLLLVLLYKGSALCFSCEIQGIRVLWFVVGHQ